MQNAGQNTGALRILNEAYTVWKDRSVWYFMNQGASLSEAHLMINSRESEIIALKQRRELEARAAAEEGTRLREIALNQERDGLQASLLGQTNEEEEAEKKKKREEEKKIKRDEERRQREEDEKFMKPLPIPEVRTISKIEC